MWFAGMPVLQRLGTEQGDGWGVAVRRLASLPACVVTALSIAAGLLFIVRVSVEPTRAGAQKLIYARKPSVENGEKVYKGGCIACHGADGTGAPQSDAVFIRPDTWPDFTACDQTTPEPNGNYKAVIVHGGPSRGFSQIMPAFGDLLTDEQINDVVAYLRTFCKNKHNYPMGELNLPRALVTEKAYPENEIVVSSTANVRGRPSWTTDVIDERTVIDPRTQLETDVPINYAVASPEEGGGPQGGWTEGVGDITLGLKREMFSNLRTGSILSLQGGVLLPTGDSNRGFGAGTTQFEPFAAFDQLFPENTFLQTQLGADLPVDSSISPRSMFYRATIGQAIAPDHMLGRLYSPMVEFLGTRDFSPGAASEWDVLPEMQITISRRQHVRVGFGYRKPIANTSGRTSQAVFYFLWDRADGRIWDGWR